MMLKRWYWLVGSVVLLAVYSCSDDSAGPVLEEDPEPLIYEVISDELVIPWQMAFSENGKLFVTERRGLVRLFLNGQLQTEPWLDLSDSLKTPDAPSVANSGLLGITLDPDFDSNGYVYLGYSYYAPSEEYDYNKLVRYIHDPETNTGTFDAILLDEIKGRGMHNTAQVKFGPDGKIYWSAGERHVVETAQDKNDPPGSILRLNSDGSVPSDNPFADNYVYAYGLRNSQGFDWHPQTGVMLATEHGPSGSQGCCHDKVNHILPGGNYGWPEIRGGETAPGMIGPLIHSGVGNDRDEYTWAPSGATFVHSGPWAGSFLFAGLRSQSLWKLDILQDGDIVEEDNLTRFTNGRFGRIRSVEQSPDGDIYIITSNLDQHDVPFEKDYLVRITIE